MSAARARVVAAACAGAALAYYLYERRRRRRRGWRLSDRLTIILCTSPVKTNPSTALIEEVHGSMRHFAPCLADCPVIVSCDGYKVREKPKYRSGQVTHEGGDAYVCRADIFSPMNDAAVATWIVRGDESRRGGRGRDVDSPWRQVAATPWPRRVEIPWR